MQQVYEQLHSDGYAIVRGFFAADDMARIVAECERIYQLGIAHPATYRDKNLLFDVLDDPKAGRRVMIQAHWTPWISPELERLRRDERYLTLLEPLLGRDIKQITHQIHWKPPGAKYTFYRYHQDARFRNPTVTRNMLYGTVNTGLAIDAQTATNGTIMTGHTPDEDLRRVGLDPDSVVSCEMQPGDLLLWTLYTVHGSAPNLSAAERRFMINSYVRAADSDRGEWTFRDGVSTALGPEPQLCKYEQQRERPGPFYVEADWTEEARAGRPR